MSEIEGYGGDMSEIESLPPFDTLFEKTPYFVFCPVCGQIAGKLKDVERFVCRDGSHGFYELKGAEIRPVDPRTRRPVRVVV